MFKYYFLLIGTNVINECSMVVVLHEEIKEMQQKLIMFNAFHFDRVPLIYFIDCHASKHVLYED